MCSIAEQVREAAVTGTPVTPAVLASAVEHARDAVRAVASLLADPAHAVVVAGMPSDVVADLATSMLVAADSASAAGTMLAGQVAASTGPGAGALIGGRYSSARRWLEADAGLSANAAKGLLARGRDLRGHSEAVGRAWLSGRVSGDAVRELTLGVSTALKPVDAPVAEVERMRADALAVLLPLAEQRPVGDVHRAVQRLAFALDPDGTSRSAMDAYDSQSLTVEAVGPMSRITAWVTHETAAAAMTVIDQEARRIASGTGRELVHAPDCALVAASTEPRADEAEDGEPLACTCGTVSSTSWAHTRAVALGNVMTGMLDNGLVGSHHGVAPHVTLTVDVDTALATLAPDGRLLLVGELSIPGKDEPVLVPDATVRRILCDADLTRVLTTTAGATGPDPVGTSAVGTGPVGTGQVGTGPVGTGPVGTSPVESGAAECSAVETALARHVAPSREARRGWHRPLGRPRTAPTRTCDHDRGGARAVLRAESREVLWVGRAQRTVPPRLRRALNARDRHCVFPGCRAPARRCHAHHVEHWEHGGDTSLENLALLCVAHHHAVHEGGWTITRAPGAEPGSSGAWTIAPPERRSRP